MSEITTCEQYVVSKLQDLENDNKSLADLLAEKTAQVRALESAFIHLFNECVEYREDNEFGHELNFTYSTWKGQKNYNFVHELYSTYVEKESE